MQCVCITLCASDAPGPDLEPELWEHIYALEARPALTFTLKFEGLATLVD